MQYDCDAAVIGGGPAGARAAELLARGGARVVICERTDGTREKLCGGLLTRRGSLALGTEPPVEVLRPVARPPLEYHDPANRLRLRYDPGYLNMRRGAFDAWLRERASQAGARLELGMDVTGWEAGPEGLRLATSRGPLSCRLLLDASGWRAVSRRLVGAAPPPMLDTLQGEIACALPPEAMWAIYLSQVTPFYGWIIPLGQGRFALGAGFPSGSLKTSAAPWDGLAPFLAYLDAAGARPRTLDPKPRGCPLCWIGGAGDLWWGAGGVIPLGEAAGLVSPASGGGIHYALEHAAAVAGVLLAAGLGRPGFAWDPQAHQGFTARVQARLAPALRHLAAACLKARIAARPPLRALAARCLPYYLARRVERLPLPAVKRI